MGNILTAIKSIVENSSITVVETSQGTSQNRANQMGDALEGYVKNAFANCLGQNTRYIQQAHSQTFSYLGNKTNPPDAILKGGDAIEIKKLASLGTSQLQLNSSYPKNKLHSDNPKICKACRECEEWKEKDPKEIRAELSKMRNALNDISTRVTEEIYRKKQERERPQER